MRRMYSKSQLQEIVKEELKADLFEHFICLMNEDQGYRVYFSYICSDKTNIGESSNWNRLLFDQIRKDNTEDLQIQMIATGIGVDTDHAVAVKPALTIGNWDVLTTGDAASLNNFLNVNTFSDITCEDTVRRIY